MSARLLVLVLALPLAACLTGPARSVRGGSSSPSLLLDRAGGVEALAWEPSERVLLLSTREAGLQRWTPGGVPFACGEVGPTALTLGPAGLVGAERVHGRVARFSAAGTRGAVLAASYAGAALTGVRSLAMHPSGALVLVDGGGRVLHLGTNGRLTAVPPTGPARCAEFRGDTLLVAPLGEPRLLRLPLNAEGVLGGEALEDLVLTTPATALEALPEGALLVGTESALQLWSASGVLLDSWRVPAPIVALAAAPAEGLAYVATEEQVYRLLLLGLAP